MDPNRTQIFGVNPLGGTTFLGTASAFVKAFLHLLAGEGVWGRGRRLSPLPRIPLEKSSSRSHRSHCSQKTAWLHPGNLPNFHAGFVVQILQGTGSPAPSAIAADCNTPR